MPVAEGARVTSPARNLHLSAEHYGTTHVDPAGTDSFPYPAPRGVFYVDLRRTPRVTGGPVGYMQLASTSPRYMWGTSTGSITYIDVSNGGFHQVARIATPGSTVVPRDTLDEVLAQRFTDIGQAQRAVTDDLGLDGSRLACNVYLCADRDNVLYANAPLGLIHAYGLIDPSTPAAGIRVLRTLDFTDTLRHVTAGGSSSMNHYGASIVGLTLTYDGNLIVLTNRSVTVLDRSFRGRRHTVEFGADEYVSSSMAVDDGNGIYVASDTTMHKVVWTGLKLSTDAADGAWSSPYDYGREPPSVKFGRGTGSTPALMGFGDDRDKLVVITDGFDRMKVVAFWREQIPDDFRQRPDARSRRIAGQIAITCGRAPRPEFIQSGQSVVVSGYGAFVVNNVRPQSAKDRLVDVIAAGPVFDPPTGAERVEWDPQLRQWRSVWTRGDVVATSMAPAMSSPSGIVFVNGYTKIDGWELTGMDWNTGETVHRTIFGQDNLGNGAYALVQFLENGDLLFNSIGGAARVELSR